MGELVLAEERGGVLTLVLNRPERLNAMNKAMIRELLEHLEAAAASASVRCIVLTGAGRGFCAGGDLADVAAGEEASVEVEERELAHLHRTSLLLRTLPQPVIAAVNGACVGAGLSWAAAADIRVASVDAVFRTSFVSAGLTGDFGLTWTLPRIVGDGRARELLFGNRKFGAGEALAMGLVSEVVEPDELSQRAGERAAELAALAPLAVAGIKANLHDALGIGFAELLDREAGRQVRASRTEDCGEAARAFLECRIPRFVGR